MRESSHRSPRRQSGFTLIELLVVIGIIAVLLGILIPTIGAVKRAGYTTATQARIRAIAEACERYYQVFEAYPGPQADGQMLPGTAGGAPRYTSSENLVLGLMGGLKPVNPITANSQPIYDKALVGKGPQNLSTYSASAWKQYEPFIDAKTAGLDTQGSSAAGWTTWANHSGEIPGKSAFADTTVPEFVDAFPDPMPILYMRAVRGAQGVKQGSNMVLIGAATDTPVTKAGYQYYPSQLGMYTFPPPSSIAAGAAQKQSQTDFPNSFNDYFKLPEDTNNPPTTVRSKDSYILISAGADRYYMTADDVCSFGKPK